MILRKPKPKQKDPLTGDYRIDTLFAWWPVRTDDGLIWMERYRRVYEWVVRGRIHSIGDYHFYANGGGWDLRQTKRVKRIQSQQ